MLARIVLALTICACGAAPGGAATQMATSAAAAPGTTAGPGVAEVLALDREWLLAYNQADARPFDRIWAEDALLVSTEGRVKTKAEEREDVASAAPPEVKASWSVTQQTARRYGKMVVVIGRFAQEGTYKDQPFTRPFRYTNVYARLKGRWRLVTSQFAPISPLRN